MKGRKRFEALRDFTVEGAEAEIDRMTRERKDIGESAAGRATSHESARGATSPRTTSLDMVPEDSAFAIGDEDDEDDEGDGESNLPSHDTSTRASMSNDALEDALPLQSRSMSEKARGKQPVGLANFSRSTSRNTSHTSLASLIRLQTRQSQQPFTPDYQWVRLTSRPCTPVRPSTRS